MPTFLPGAKDAGETEPSIHVTSFAFSNFEVAVLQQVINFWSDIFEAGARPFFSPVSAYLSLPHLRAFWPISSVDENATIYDLSGQARTLTYNTTATAGFRTRNFTPVAVLASRNNDHLARAHEAGLDVLANLSFGLWLKVLAGSAGGMVMGKSGPAGSLSWHIALENAAGTPRFRFYASADGTGTIYSERTPATTIATWHLLLATYDPAGAPILYLDGQPPTSPPSGSGLGTLYAAGQPLAIGHANDPGAGYLDAEVALPFLCAATLTPETVTQLYATTRELLP